MKDNVMKSINIVKYDGDSFRHVQDQVANEYALTIYVNDDEFATMVCTPTYMEDLVTGFLASEGVIRLPREIESLSIDEDRGFAYVQLVDKKPVANQLQSKRFIGSCCGKSRQFYFQSDVKNAKTILSKSTIGAEECIKLMEAMQDCSDDFHSTGGLHNAALCTSDELLLSRSDIGRHNALDKIYGHCLKNKIALGDKVIAFSGRISSEVLLKVSKIGAGIILSKSAPTTLALELAHDLGITAVGFIRGSRLNVYTHPERIIL
ncbi:formate dehydrogenase accessory sulfurtransferase FdhD [Fictibacillus sp. NRS-1165]|uniref:formate dehydrogenase accessory sulfurtransferase FdhD n=1 Tax=Fictibacillus sp. NRS-1165 TaxID=3144463 RepID=UPI003D19A8EC